MTLSPIVLFVYNRPWHTRQTVEALQKNELAQESELFIFSDGPKNEAAEENVREVRSYVRTISGFKKISIVEREKNWGLADSIIDGVTQVVNQYGRVIVLEDDLVTSPYFLKFMNDALEIYKDKEKVMHITGYMFPINPHGLEQTVFDKMSSGLGWGTWERAWRHFKRNPDELIKEFKHGKINQFNLDGAYRFWDQVVANYKGRMKTWGVFWYATVFKQNGLCVHPSVSLVQHIGYDIGVHFKQVNLSDPYPSQSPITFFETKIEENPVVSERLKKYFLSMKPPLWRKIAGKIRRCFFAG